MNYTLQDIFSSALAFILFPLVVVIPGYVFGWTFDLFNFKKRHPITRFVIALVLSIAVSPILFFLTYRLFSRGFALFLVFTILFGFIGIMVRSPNWVGMGISIETTSRLKGVRRVAVIIGGAWALFVILYLADWQFGNKLYYTVITYDYTTRVSIIDAITRTNIPPVNPSYYPEHPVKLTFLYYFWYLICSLIDQIGGKWVTARTALHASIAWCGLALMATIALYLRQRNKQSSLSIWKQALIGAGCLLISGLDVIPTALYTSLYALRWTWGDIEHWNEQITAWVGSILWVPLHITSLIACIAGLLLFLHARERRGKEKFVTLIFTGLSFASAFGLSVYVTLVFIIFWGIWLTTQLLKQSKRNQAWLMLVPGVIAAVAISPFIFDLLQNSAVSGSGGSPFTIMVREFYPLSGFIKNSPVWVRALALTAVLPINYLMELGFFLITGLVWLQLFRRSAKNHGVFYEVELLLLIITIILATFVRSKVIASNDFGWRSWLVGQFVLLIWSTDLLDYLRSRKSHQMPQNNTRITLRLRLKKVLVIFIATGMLTTLFDLTLLRIWPVLADAGWAGFPNMLSQDNRLGERAFAAREMYGYLDANVPETGIIQFNPRVFLDRPSGLYRTRQAVISTHTLYGVSAIQTNTLMKEIDALFDSSLTEWQALDQICNNNLITTIIYSDYDPIWVEMDQLKAGRNPLFESQFFVVFACGK